jgi:phosphoserine phosphatase
MPKLDNQRPLGSQPDRHFELLSSLTMIQLVVFDLDGTLLRGPTVCEVLARPLGHLERMQQLERGACSIEAARAEMARWYSGSGQSLEELTAHLAGAELAPGADEGCASLHDAGVEIAIASVTWSFAVAHFAKRFRASPWLGTSLGPKGEIGHVFAADKETWLEGLRQERGLRRSEVAAIGDSANDLPMLRAAGLAVYVGAAPPAAAGIIHLPNADIRLVVQRLLAQ